MKITVEIDVFPGERHCCDISAGSGPRKYCEFLELLEYCSHFKKKLKRDTDLFTTIKCDECKAAYQKALKEPGRKMKDWDNWKPTANNINALPEKVKAYVCGLETLCDPAGIIAENVFLKDEMSMFIEALKIKEIEKELQKCQNPKCNKEWNDVMEKCCEHCGNEIPF